MSDSREYVNELIKDAAYEAVKHSELFDVLSNAEVDAKADELAKLIRARVDTFLVENETALAVAEVV